MHWFLYTEPNLCWRNILQRGAALLLSLRVFICSWHVQLSIRLTPWKIFFTRAIIPLFWSRRLSCYRIQMTVENGATGDLGDMAPELKKMSLSTDCSVKCKRLLIGRKNPTRLWITLHFSHGKNTWNGLSTSWRCPSSPPWEAKIQQPRQVELELRRSRPILNSRD